MGLTPQMTMRVVWSEPDGAVVTDIRAGSLCAVTTWAGVLEGDDVRRTGEPKAELVLPGELIRTVTARVPRLPDPGEVAAPLPHAPAGSDPQVLGAALAVLVERGDEPVLGATLWVVHGRWFLIHEDERTRTHLPVPQGFVDYLLGHACLVVTQSEEVADCA